MFKKFITIASVLLLFGIFSSCQKNDEEDQTFQYIELEFFEQFTAEGSEIHFNLQTIETFPCSNFSLDVNVSPGTSHTEIKITDIDVPDICFTALGPASKVIQLGAIQNVSHGFTIWVNDKRHDFQLKTENKYISVSPGTPFDDHLFFTFDSLMRIPANTVWGYVVSESNTRSNAIWNEILDAFYNTGAKQMQLANGNYYFFTVSNEEIVFESAKEQSLTFYFQFEDSIETLIEIYERVIGEYEQPDVQLRLFNTKGERFVI